MRTIVQRNSERNGCAARQSGSAKQGKSVLVGGGGGGGLHPAGVFVEHKGGQKLIVPPRVRHAFSVAWYKQQCVLLPKQ